jgi:hypothetical protein
MTRSGPARYCRIERTAGNSVNVRVAPRESKTPVPDLLVWDGSVVFSDALEGYACCCSQTRVAPRVKTRP